MKCKKCGKLLLSNYIEKWKYVKTAVCPHCGALNSYRRTKAIIKGVQGCDRL